MASSFKPRRLKPRQHDVYSLACAIPILELMQIPGFSEDLRWIQKRLHFRAGLAAIRRALRLLEERGLARRNEEGQLEPVNLNTISTIPAPQVVRTYHDAMLKHARQCLHELPRSARHVSSLTMPMSVGEYRNLCERIDDLRKEIQREFGTLEGEKSDRVYCLGIQVIPVAN